MSDDELGQVLLSDAKDRMEKALSHTKADFSSVRSGRATSGLVEHIRVELYGSESELRAVAGISVPESRMLVVTPYDRSTLGAIEKALLSSDLGINPSNDGAVIRLVIPPLTEERRKELVKVVRHKAEEGRVAVRSVRRAVRHELESLESGGDLSKDEAERIERELEKLTHEQVAAVDTLLAHKEQELLEI